MSELDNKDDSSEIFEKSEFTWILKFSEVSNEYKVGAKLQSPLFPEAERKFKWTLSFYPNGNEDEKYVSLYLDYASVFSSPVPFKYNFILKNSDDEVLCEKMGDHIFEKSTLDWGYANLINRAELISSLRDDDVLKISVVVCAEVFTIQPYHSLNIQEELCPSMKLAREFGNMFQNREFSDFIIKCNDACEIPVYRGILAARSPVFSAMFKHDTSENKSGSVTITDIESDTMLRLLNFIYAGETNDSEQEEMEKLLVAANKYEVQGLKQFCEEKLAEKLKVSNVLDILVLSDLHNCEELKQKALNYIIANSKKFCNPSFLKKIASLSSEVLAMILQFVLNKV